MQAVQDDRYRSRSEFNMRPSSQHIHSGLTAVVTQSIFICWRQCQFRARLNNTSLRILQHTLQLSRHVLVLDSKYLLSAEPRKMFQCPKIM